ncbi:bifunctional 2-keto-4-hydroxyglutarate aldolase/2-keto-3-deoxy-6-phosphogluconate aldolase [Niallia circulans]|jgi:2-dehydro-3-deoxyphosphogluconate aldolase / (4S)-4-hydroxy-2-oxoglutarate aldolase|uniref:Ketohydroxyglutarate aldolase n=1 Tax=Niallia circulans TaxID=1397 RepID=A0A0J1IL24_NIACI|nr:bifunctional 2-keto-4-hydroxyglutarate aldolase/2-keto-3-deoxy-6-phosphogluconate aldolase [Niallia circulans]KLV26583.1 ketohydroxyglutarate aldolase [Niallia circulans]MED5099853.1 bifunctional 2-keto-4-hydroxyglutarate aldolase/2-keto-3-deoxy-6-phosphogluconate aldolase [Niallia circulans]PAD23925.1 bifunctional 2-keto-4-hydroxyglutarate aldolase/2-keto-3-deoxy-6-phosphogluconate aldolase [Niallia circulans]PAD85567.1 bifunctional 2-keto-4-hydroxyglutarate aldolase/2-keto-3-deoxy-6-phosph
MDKIEVLAKMKEEKIVAVIRAQNIEQGLHVSEAIRQGGIKFLELTMTIPGALDVIKKLADKYAGEDVIVGAGTVLDPETARLAILAGAKFIVGPNLSPEVITMCHRYRVAVMPGVMSPTEALTAIELGADVIKVFPGGAFGPSIVKDFKGPLPQGNFMPSGGVTVENAAEWIKNGAYAIGTGSSLTKGAATGDYEAVTREAEKFVAIVK